VASLPLPSFLLAALSPFLPGVVSCAVAAGMALKTNIDLSRVATMVIFLIPHLLVGFKMPKQAAPDKYPYLGGK
jgi:hypothetical protein